VRIAFLASRKGYLKVMGSLVQAALEHGHEAVLLADPSERKPGEATTEEDFRHWPAARVVRVQRGAPLSPVLASARVDALVAPSLHFLLVSMGLESEIGPLRAAGVRLYSVDYIVEAVNGRPEAHRVLDRVFYTSEYERRFHRELFEKEFAAVRAEVSLDARSAVCGSTMLDQLAVVDREAVRRRLGFGPDKPVVLLMSLKMAVPEPWRRFVWGDGPALVRSLRAVAHRRADLVPDIWRGNGYRALAQAVRRFCDRSGAALVVKSREKNRDPRFLRGVADLLVERDDEVFPYTSIELMAVASLCVHFRSGAVMEAAMASVPSVSVAVPQTHLEGNPSFEEIYGTHAGSLQHYPGVVWSTPHDGVAALLDGRTLADFRVDPAARRGYVERYLGFDDLKSSERVLREIERDAPLTSGGPAAAPPA
jgi:hypothetical protein